MKRALWALVIAVPLVALLAAGFGRDPSAISSPLLNKQAPAFTLRSLDGKPVSLVSLRGKPVIVNFWASWCLSCKDEHTYLLDAWRAYSSRGVAFLGVIYQDTPSDARAFLNQNGRGWPQLRDPGQQTAVDYGVVKIPETYFIDRHGIIRYKSLGPVTPELLAQQIGRLLGKEA